MESTVIKTAVIDGKRMYHITEAARMCGVSERTVYRHMKAGDITGRRFGRSWYFEAKEIRKVAKNGKEA